MVLISRRPLPFVFQIFLARMFGDFPGHLRLDEALARHRVRIKNHTVRFAFGVESALCPKTHRAAAPAWMGSVPSLYPRGCPPSSPPAARRAFLCFLDFPGVSAGNVLGIRKNSLSSHGIMWRFLIVPSRVIDRSTKFCAKPRTTDCARLLRCFLNFSRAQPDTGLKKGNQIRVTPLCFLKISSPLNALTLPGGLLPQSHHAAWPQRGLPARFYPTRKVPLLPQFYARLSFPFPRV